MVAVHLGLPVGSGDEPQGLSGLAHVSEHLAYAGLAPENPRGFPSLIQSRGGIPGAFTAHDRSHYFEILPADQVTLGLWIEAQRLGHRGAPISKEILDRERAVLLEERAQHVENPPYGSLYEDLHRALYPAPHPYHHSPMGDRVGLEAVTPEDCNAFLQAGLAVDGAVLVVTGRFSSRDLRKQIEELFSELPRPLPRPEPAHEHIQAAGERYVRLVRKVPFVRSILAFRIPGEGRSGFHAAAVLAALLGSDNVGPLQQRLVQDSGVAQSVTVGLVEMRRASTLVIDAMAASGTSRRRLEEELSRAVQEFLTQEPSIQAVEAACRDRLKALACSIDALDTRAETLARLELLKPGAGLQQEVDHYRSVDEMAIRSLVERSCQPRHQVLLSVEAPGDTR